MNLTKQPNSRVDIEPTWYNDQLHIKFVRTDDDTGTSTFHISLDDIDLEHFIATLITLQR